MNIVLAGGSGLVGSALLPVLRSSGHDVKQLVRRKVNNPDKEIEWDPEGGNLDVAHFEGTDAVVHLGGENIAQGRWTSAKKQRILDSRVNSTRLLSETIAQCNDKPRVFVVASAIGYYGDRGDELLVEDSPPGKDYLADVCQRWEQAAGAAKEMSIRVVNLRIGVVLSPHGGALKKMLTPFRLGAGGVVGSGEQYWSWIALDDLVAIIQHTLASESLNGAVNAVSPLPSTNREFTKTLGKVLRRPTIFPMPGFVARAVLGEMAEALLLASTRVQPQKLLDSGYEFRYPDLESSLKHLLQC